MLKNKIKAFTMVELVIVVTIMWLLILATTVYLGWSGEKRKVIEGQWCAAALWGEISNYVFYTLTSKKLRLSDTETVSPDYYIIQFTWWNSAICSSWNECDKIVFSYSTWDLTNIKDYKTVDVTNTCRQNRQNLKFYRSWTDTEYIIMNKWLSPKSISDQEVFYLAWSGWMKLVWDIIVWLCLNSECSNPKQLWKFVADARPQTISLKNCRFYQVEDPTKCEERES